MRWLIWAVVAAALVWSGVWLAGSTVLRRAAGDAAQDLVARGLAERAPDVAVRGYPNRLDLTLSGIALADPASGLRYEAPFLQVFALVYRPWHVIAALPPEQRLTLPDGTAATLTAGRLRLSVVAEPATALPLDRLVFEGEGLRLVLAGPEAPAPAAAGTGAATGLALATLQLATRRDPSRLNWHELDLAAAGLAPDPAFFAALPEGRSLPPEIARLHLRAFAGLSAPLDRFAGRTMPRLAALDLTEALLDWGTLRISAAGSLAPDAQGLAEGRIDIRIDDWPAALDAAVAAGLIRPEIAPTWAEFARRLTEGSDDPMRLDLPLVYARGRASLGPLPLGPAPRLGAP